LHCASPFAGYLPRFFALCQRRRTRHYLRFFFIFHGHRFDICHFSFALLLPMPLSCDAYAVTPAAFAIFIDAAPLLTLRPGCFARRISCRTAAYHYADTPPRRRR
jgi:hypothetical protein